jgi:tetrahydromethanopterin S-methyltransferase subunit H
MFNFEEEQTVHEIGNVLIGGQPGENPTVLVGSIFYHDHDIVLDDKNGVFDKAKAEELINLQEEWSSVTGNSCMLDVIGNTPKAMEKYIGFVIEHTDAPILIDSPSVEGRIGGLKYAREIGIGNRVVYNSLIVEANTEEYQAIEDAKIESAVLLAYSRGFLGSKARIDNVNELLRKAGNVGIKKPLIDTYVLDLLSLSVASKTILQLKESLGVPCGCGAHNALSTWRYEKRLGIEAKVPCMVAIDTLPVMFGADFIIYGPIENCVQVFPAVYSVDTSYRFLRRMKETIDL